MDIDKRTWWIIGGIAGAVLLLLVLWFLTSKQVPKSAETSTDTSSQFPAYTANTSLSTSSEVMQVVASGETIAVNDQAAGMNVAVTNVMLTKPSWVAIRDTKGWILGAGWFGMSAENVSVSLLRGTLAGQTYQAVIYVDNGDKTFDLHADSIVIASESAPVSATFNAK